jgi:hypothetical protein
MTSGTTDPTTGGGDDEVLLVTQDGTTGVGYDQQLFDILVAEGFDVTVLSDDVASASDAAGVAAVVISETVDDTDVGAEFRTVAVPVLVLEGTLWDDMDMAPAGNANSNDIVSIVNPANPLSGGQTGTFAIATGSGAGVRHTSPLGGATIVLVRPGNPGQVVEFAFDTGATMENTFVAPARRLGLGIEHDHSSPAGAALTTEGEALFEAAITWATP